jgi:hypothetical protein
MRMNIFGFQMAVKNFLKRNTINFLNYGLILRRSVVDKFTLPPAVLPTGATYRRC